MSGLLEISTVVGCKMMCDYCPQRIHVSNYADKSDKFSMSLDDLKKYVSTVPVEIDIVFAGMAEPFLNRQASDMILYAGEKVHIISLYTTCEAMTHDDVDKISKLKFNHFCLHLPDSGGRMNIRITDHYISIVARVMSLQNNLMCIGSVHPIVQDVVGVKVDDGSAGLFSRAGNIRKMMIPRKGGRIFCSVCTENLNHNVLLPNGDVLLCCMDYAQDHVIGNLNSMTYAELFKSGEYTRIMNGMSDDSIKTLCRTCEVSSIVN